MTDDAQHREGALFIECGCGQSFFRDLIGLGVHLQLEHPDRWVLYEKFMKLVGKRTKGTKYNAEEFQKVLREISIEVYGTAYPNIGVGKK